MDKRETFYKDADEYWSQVPATMDGMLGGFADISTVDIKGSKEFLKRFIKQVDTSPTRPRRALDCGAGIGRVTKNLLVPHFDTVDMVELNQTFLDEAKRGFSYNSTTKERVERYICSGLQDFVPETGRYDVIWSQWVLGHLTDTDLVKFFERCKRGLAENGIIVVKENMASSNSTDFDDLDSSYTRPRSALVHLMTLAGLRIIHEQKQKGFPKGIYTVIMFALQ